MKNILRVSAFGAVVFLMLATSAQTFAQQVRSRSLAPAFDFTNIQMPVEIVSIKLNGKEVQPGEKIEADDDWLLGLSFKLKNLSDRPIAFIDIGLRFPQPNGFVVYSLNYGVDFSRGEPRREGSPRAIEPGATFDLTLSKEKYASFQRVLALGGASSSFDTVPYFIGRVCFEGEPDVIWEGGNLKQRDPYEFTKFNVIERYVLPATGKSAAQEKPPSIRPRFVFVPAEQRCQPAWVKGVAFGRQPMDALLAQVIVENLSNKRMTEVKLGWKVYSYPEGLKVKDTYCAPQPTYGEVLLSGTTQSIRLDALGPKEICNIGINPLPIPVIKATKTVFVDQPLLTAEDVKSLPLDGDPLKVKYVVVMYVFEIHYDDGTSWTA